MIKIAICDNDFFYRRDLEQLCLAYYGNDCEILLFDDSERLIAGLENNIFDIIFLDMEKRHKNGVEVKRGIEVKRYLEDHGIESAVIFITGDAAHMQEAFGRNVYGYMEKPVQKEQLFSLLDRVHAVSDFNRTLLIKDIYGRDRLLKTRDIYYIGGELNYTRIFFAEDESLLVYCTLKRWMELLDNRFFIRIHKSYIVNLSHVSSMDKEAWLENYVLPVAKGRLKQVRQLYRAYLTRKQGV